MITSMSKRMMNEVMVTAQDSALPVYITDTDSMHLLADDLPTLESAYESRYGRALVGKALGQFHSDFEIEGHDCEEVWSEALVAVGKKCYANKLVGRKADGTLVDGWHVRMKGVTDDAVEALAEANNMTLMELYEYLHDDGAAAFDLLAAPEGRRAKPKFKLHNNLRIETRSAFVRTVFFGDADDRADAVATSCLRMPTKPLFRT
jgi:hypothetical protein